MSFIWPRTVTISRPGQAAGVGFQPGYEGQTPAAETIIASDIPASVQAQREGQHNPVGLPADGARPIWRIYIPLRALAKGSVLDRDIVTDDEGGRFQVVAAYWDSLGYRLHAERLEA